MLLMVNPWVSQKMFLNPIEVLVLLMVVMDDYLMVVCQVARKVQKVGFMVGIKNHYAISMTMIATYYRMNSMQNGQSRN